MSTTNYSVGTSWVEVSATDNELQNKGSVPIRLHYGISAPAQDTEDYLLIEAGKANLRKDNFPSGNTYVRTDRPNNDTGLYDVVVAEL